MKFQKILIANRGEVAIRVARASAELGIRTVTVYSTDDAEAMHLGFGDERVALAGRGASAYLDQTALLDAALEAGCDAVHPGYGFLSENADFAASIEGAGLRFIGPDSGTLRTLGDKVRARALARSCGVPVGDGSESAVSVDDVRGYLAELGGDGAIMLKPLSGGGGRGMAKVTPADDLDEVFSRCAAEAAAAFGSGELYFERLVQRARHIEVQIIGDGETVSHLWERECSLQRRHQKVMEIAPAPFLGEDLRHKLVASAVKMAEAVNYCGLATFEFLVDEHHQDAPEGFVFLEANPRLQVEHTVTEAVTGVDLVTAQIEVVAGTSLRQLSLTQAEIREPHGTAIQLRLNAESYAADGGIRPAYGAISALDLPTGPGVRVDTSARVGFSPNPSFDALLAKIVVHSSASTFGAALAKTRRALSELRLVGLESNAPFLEALLRRPELEEGRFDTAFVDHLLGELIGAGASVVSQFGGGYDDHTGLWHVRSDLAGVLSELLAAEGDEVRPGETVARIESMKMEHPVIAAHAGIVERLCAAPGTTVQAGTELLLVQGVALAESDQAESDELDPDHVRSDLAGLHERLERTLDEARVAQVARRHALGSRTARENIADLVDPGSFSEYGALVVAAQRTRRTHEDLLRVSPADGLVCGVGSINGREHPGASSAVVLAYDWTVFGGTQGMLGHNKMDRMLEIAYAQKLPVVWFAEGGGGRPGDTEYTGSASLDIMSFWHLARLDGRVPTVGIANRFCFAGNAAVLTLCELIIATKDSYIGMGGPAMIDGGGLGKVAPREIGPAPELARIGVVDVMVEDESEAVAVAKRYLSFFQGDTQPPAVRDQRLLRHMVPENRKRPYEVREVIDLLSDEGSVLELRSEFGEGAVTSLARIDGTAIGIIANNSKYLGGAIDRDAAIKIAGFMRLCEQRRLPLVTLIDTPGFMVGPQAEATGQASCFGELFKAGSSLTVPLISVILRKAYGLGAMAAAGGSLRASQLTVAWPTGELGAMGFEGAVRLGYSKELAAIDDPLARETKFKDLLKELYARGAAHSAAEFNEIDAVIDPAETRGWLVRALLAARSVAG